jgi:hypothetical protein
MIVFFKRLKVIEEELWGIKEQEAIATATQEQREQQPAPEKQNRT